MFIVRATALKVQNRFRVSNTSSSSTKSNPSIAIKPKFPEKVRKKNWIPLAIAREDDKIYKTYIPPTVPEF